MERNRNFNSSRNTRPISYSRHTPRNGDSLASSFFSGFSAWSSYAFSGSPSMRGIILLRSLPRAASSWACGGIRVLHFPFETKRNLWARFSGTEKQFFPTFPKEEKRPSRERAPSQRRLRSFLLWRQLRRAHLSSGSREHSAGAPRAQCRPRLSSQWEAWRSLPQAIHMAFLLLSREEGIYRTPSNIPRRSAETRESVPGQRHPGALPVLQVLPSSRHHQ